MDAHTVEQLDQRLKDAGYWLVEAKPAVRRKKTKRPVWVKRLELIEFCYAMQALLDGGVTLNDALDALAKEAQSSGLAGILADLKLHIEAGDTLHNALNKYPDIFPKQMVHLVRAGEYSGDFATAFAETARHLEWAEEIVSELKQVSIYPALVVCALGLFALLLFGFVVPTFTGLLTELGIALPWITQLTMGIGQFVYHYWLVLIGIMIAIPVSYVSVRRRSYAASLWLDKLKLSLPLIGEVLKMVAISRFARNMVLLLRAGVTLQRALNLSRGIVGNLAVAEAVKDAEVAVNDGETMSAAFRGHHCFAPLELRLIVVGEETGSIERSFQNISARFDKEIPRRIKRFLSIVEPTVVIVLIGLVGTVALAIFLPFLDLLGGIL